MEYDIVDRLETVYSVEDDKKWLNSMDKLGWRLNSVVRVKVKGYDNLYCNRYYLERKGIF